jgi:hypothetical protein
MINQVLDQRNQDYIYMSKEVWDSASCWSQSTCRALLYYDPANAVKVPSNDGVLVLHLYPKVLWAPRNVLTGSPDMNATLLMPTSDARTLRFKALQPGAGDGALDIGWRTPIIAEDSSAISSIMMKFDGTNPDANGFLWVQDRSAKPKWSHNPPVAIQLDRANAMDPSYLASRIMAAFSATNPTASANFLTLPTRCGNNWALDEQSIAHQMYGPGPVDTSWPTSKVPYCYSSAADEAAALTDGREKTRLQANVRPCVLFSSGGPSTALTKRWRLLNDPETGTTYDVGDFIWKGCPDMPTQFWTTAPPKGLPNEIDIRIITGYQMISAGRHGGFTVPVYTSFMQDFLNRNRLESFMRTQYNRCDPVAVLHSCSTFDWIWQMLAYNPTLDPTQELTQTAYRKRNGACMDVNALNNELTDLAAEDPNSLPNFNKCTDIHKYNAATYPYLWNVDLTMYPPPQLFQ